MKDKEKQIEEMAIEDIVKVYPEISKPTAFGIVSILKFNYYQPKLPEDSVVNTPTTQCETYSQNDMIVLSKEECKNIYEQAEQNVLANIADGGTSCHWCIEQHEKKASKETAEKIYDFVERYIMDDAEVELLVKQWFEEQFGVEIKE